MTLKTNNESTPFSIETIIDTLEAQKANRKVEITYSAKNNQAKINISDGKLLVTYLNVLKGKK